MKKKSGSWFFWAAALMVIPLWLISFPESTIRYNLKPLLVYGSQVAALTGFALFALTFVLSARLKWLEDYFGGLDKIYHVHHTMGKAALLLLLVHPVTLSFRFIPEDPGRLLWYLFPFHRKFEVNMGSWALWGLILLMVLTLLIRKPYDKWKISHKFMGFFFILGVAHVYLLDLSFSSNPALAAYLSVLSIAGIAAWVYKSVIFDFVTTKFRFRVEKVDRLNEKVMEITLKPVHDGISYTPGQFYFFSFISPRLTRESHPYTVCESLPGGDITIMVKSSGDYTHLLYQHLEAGATALLEGPYGRFDYRAAGRNQLWIGGGVGIAPFISWANDLKQTSQPDVNAELYYCVNTEKDATHLHLFRDLEEQIKGFRMTLVRADVEGFMNPEKIADISEKEIFLCGPKEMRKDLLLKLRNQGVSDYAIHYEDFDI
jgi:predicted ferric reductase